MVPAKMTMLSMLIWFGCLGSFNAYGQKALKESIRKAVLQINSDSSLVPVVLENEDFLKPLTDGGGKLTGYYKGKQLLKIVSWIGISHGTEVVEFYFKGPQLLFIYEQFNSFVYDAKADSVRFNETERTFEGRYWFDRGKMIDHITTGHNRFENDALDPAIVWPGEANELKRLLDKKRDFLVGPN